jgi:hypothetical protein
MGFAVGYEEGFEEIPDSLNELAIHWADQSGCGEISSHTCQRSKNLQNAALSTEFRFLT